MRILLINELFTMAGSEIQTLREKNILEKNGHHVWHLTFDVSLDYTTDPDDSHHINIVPFKCHSLMDKIKEFFFKWAFVDPVYRKKLVELFETIQPDVIHLNVNNYKQISLYSALILYPTVQTIRDFSAICPSRLCVTGTFKTCKGYCYGKCIKDCMPKTSVRDRIRFLLLKWNIRRVHEYRKRAVDLNVCPSQYLTDACCNNAIPTQCLNNSFDFKIIEGFEKDVDLEHKIFMVYGIVAEHKGIRQIVEAFDKFAKGKNVELQIVGKVLDSFQGTFNELLQGKEKISYLGVKKYDEIIQHLKNVYSIIVPSLWLENYPNTALEGLATRCLVIGSNRGGIPELIADDRFTFDVLDPHDIVDKLEISYNLSRDEYIKIVEKNFERIQNNNSLEIYYKRLIGVFRILVDNKC